MGSTCHGRFVSLMILCVTCSACGSDSGAEGAPSGGGMCIADDTQCGPQDDVCVGDCQGRTCCSGLCAGQWCTPENVTFGGTCTAACGGDPQGDWQYVGACVPTACEGRGALSAAGMFTVSVDSTAAVEVAYDFHCDGYINTGGGRTLGGDWSEADSTVGGSPYCVSGDTLFIQYADEYSLSDVVLEFRRAGM